MIFLILFCFTFSLISIFQTVYAQSSTKNLEYEKKLKEYEKKKAEEARRNAERAEQQRIAEQRMEEERKRALEEEKIRAQKQKELSYKRENLKRAIEQEENILSNLIRAQKDRYNRSIFDAKVAIDRFNDRRVAEIYRKDAERMKDQDQLVIDSLREKIDDMNKKLQILE